MSESTLLAQGKGVSTLLAGNLHVPSAFSRWNLMSGIIAIVRVPHLPEPSGNLNRVVRDDLRVTVPCVRHWRDRVASLRK